MQSVFLCNLNVQHHLQLNQYTNVTDKMWRGNRDSMLIILSFKPCIKTKFSARFHQRHKFERCKEAGWRSTVKSRCVCENESPILRLVTLCWWHSIWCSHRQNTCLVIIYLGVARGAKLLAAAALQWFSAPGGRWGVSFKRKNARLMLLTDSLFQALVWFRVDIPTFTPVSHLMGKLFQMSDSTNKLGTAWMSSVHHVNRVRQSCKFNLHSLPVASVRHETSQCP